MENSKVVYLDNKSSETYTNVRIENLRTSCDAVRIIPIDAILDGITDHFMYPYDFQTFLRYRRNGRSI